MESLELAWSIRRNALDMTHISKGSHIACVLSSADILAVLYTDILHVDPETVKDPARDVFIMSKGHAGAGVYVALAEKGFIPKEILTTHYADGSILSGHVSHKGVRGVELSTGSLGHGCCVGAGMAFIKKNEELGGRVFALVGDGECEEGSVWEMALFARHYKLDNFTLIIDHNKMQSLNTCKNTMDFDHLAERFQAFGWNVIEIDGHDHKELKEALSISKDGVPTCVVANTIKGKGISFMENNILWHYRDPQGEAYDKAVKELELKRK